MRFADETRQRTVHIGDDDGKVVQSVAAEEVKDLVHVGNHDVEVSHRCQGVPIVSHHRK